LRPVAAVPCVVPQAAPVIVPVRPEPKVIPLVPVEETPERRFPWLTAAAAVALLSTAATWWVVSTKGPSGAQWSGFDLFTSTEPATYQQRTASNGDLLEPIDTTSWSLPSGPTGVQELPVPGDDGTTLLVDMGQPAAEAPEASVTQPERQVAVPKSTAVAVTAPRIRFHVIGGCFLQKENAEGFMADLRAKGFAASIIDHKGGLYRVAIGSYPQRALALEALAAVRKEEAPQAWLLVR
jgi:cell division protein FtsN